jgi:hypothetical protein
MLFPEGLKSKNALPEGVNYTDFFAFQRGKIPKSRGPRQGGFWFFNVIAHFIRISMVFFVLKGGEYALRYLRYKQLSRKIVKMSLVDKELIKCWVEILLSFFL